MHRLPTVAAIIPCFNAAQFVGDAIQSALAQTYPRLEVVVVDDGSTDGLTDALRPFRDRIKLVIQPHQGLSAARNRGIRETEGADTDGVAFFFARSIHHRFIRAA